MRILAFDLGSNMGEADNLHGEKRAIGVHFDGKRLEVLPQVLYWLTGIREKASAEGCLPDLVIYERPFARGEAATRMLWGIAGLIEAVFGPVAFVSCVPPSEVKRYSTGDARADKEAMTFTAQINGYVGDNEHAADAYCLLLYAEATSTKTGEPEAWATALQTQKSSSSSASSPTSPPGSRRRGRKASPKTITTTSCEPPPTDT